MEREQTARRGQRARWTGALLALLMAATVLAGCGGGGVGRDHPLTDGNDALAASVSSASATPGAQSFAVNVQSASTTAYPGGYMSLAIVTAPYAACSFTVDYGTGSASRSLGVIPRTADGSGLVSWRWQVSLAAHTGTWPLKISAVRPNGAAATSTVNVRVTLPPIVVVSDHTSMSAYPRGTMELTIQTAPLSSGALLLQDARTAARPLLATADASGTASWTWRVGPDSAPGTYWLPVTVTLRDGEQTTTRVEMIIL